MATNGCMKMDPIPLPKKVEIREVIEETYVEEQELKAEVICRMPVTKFDCELKPAKMFKEFECEYPTVDANVNRVRQPLPFPDKLGDVIAWTDAFVDRIASMTAAQEKKTIRDMTLLAREIERLRTQLATTGVELDKTRDEVKNAKDQTEAVKRDLVASQTESKAYAQTIKDMEARAAKEAAEEKLLRQQNRTLSADLALAMRSNTELRNKLTKENKKLAEEHARWEKEHKLHVEDHDALKKEHESFEAERKAKRATQKELADVQAQLNKVKIASDAKDKTIKSLSAEIVSLKADLAATDLRNIELQEDLKNTAEKLTASEHGLQEAKAAISALTTEVTAAKERISSLDEKLQTAEATIIALKEQITNITTEKEATIAELTKTQTELTKANTDVTALRADLQKANSKATELESSLSTARNESDKFESAMLQAQEEKKRAVKDLKDEQETQQKELDGANARTEKLQARLRELKDYDSSLQELQKKLSATEKRLIPSPPVDSKRINILSVEYGGRAYTYTSHKSVLTKLYAHATKGTPVPIENDFFEGDPWRGVNKTCSITYQLDGEGAPMQIVGKEHEKITFRLKRE